MITPAFSPTATERVLPRLALDFTTAVLDPRVTVTRALNTATRINSSGQFEVVNANLPRFDYDPTTLRCKGLLIEETRINYILNSGYINAVAGTPGTAPTSWVTPASTGRISNVSSDNVGGNILEVTVSASRYILQQTINVTANTTYQVSMYVDANNGLTYNNIFFALNGPTGTTYTFYADGVLVVDNTTYVPTAGQRLSIVVAVAATAGTLNLRCGGGVGGNATGVVSFSKFQVEIGGFVTSYIPTPTAATATRNADVVSMTGANFSDWYNASEGAFVARHTGTVGSYAFAANDGTGNNYIGVVLQSATTVRGVLTASGSYQFVTNSVTSVGAVNKTSLSYKVNSVAAATNGGTVATNNTITIPAVNRLFIGSFGGFGFLNGCVGYLSFYPQRLINAENQAFSK